MMDDKGYIGQCPVQPYGGHGFTGARQAERIEH